MAGARGQAQHGLKAAAMPRAQAAPAHLRPGVRWGRGGGHTAGEPTEHRENQELKAKKASVVFRGRKENKVCQVFRGLKVRRVTVVIQVFVDSRANMF